MRCGTGFAALSADQWAVPPPPLPLPPPPQQQQRASCSPDTTAAELHDSHAAPPSPANAAAHLAALPQPSPPAQPPPRPSQLSPQLAAASGRSAADDAASCGSLQSVRSGRHAGAHEAATPPPQPLPPEVGPPPAASGQPRREHRVQLQRERQQERPAVQSLHRKRHTCCQEYRVVLHTVGASSSPEVIGRLAAPVHLTLHGTHGTGERHALTGSGFEQSR